MHTLAFDTDLATGEFLFGDAATILCFFFPQRMERVAADEMIAALLCGVLLFLSRTHLFFFSLLFFSASALSNLKTALRVLCIMDQ